MGNEGEVTGGPVHGTSSDGGEVKAPVTDEKKVLFEGVGGKFHTPEELIEYTKTVEAKLAEKTAAAPKVEPTASHLAPTVRVPVEKTKLEQIGELIFQDPEKALQLHEEVILEKIDERDANKAKERQWWDEFYDENPDLKALERVVKSVVRDNWEEVSRLDLRAAKVRVAQESRKVVDLVKSQLGVKTTELDSRPATQFGATVGSRQPLPPETPKRLSFTEQIQKIRKKG